MLTTKVGKKTNVSSVANTGKKLKLFKGVRKTPSHYYLRIYSRHPSIDPLRNTVLIKGSKVAYRHGSTTEGEITREINSVISVKTSADKLLMKEAFDKAGVKHAAWLPLVTSVKDTKVWDEFLKTLAFGKEKDSWLIIKHRLGSRGSGNLLVKTKAELDDFLKTRKNNLINYIIEEYKSYSVEYRLHVSEDGCFYTNRKMLKSDTPKDKRFQRHDDNCKWFLETNPSFNKPINWNEIVEDCIKALKGIGADVLAFDVKCSSKKNSKDGKVKWILIESGSAPSMGDGTLVKYREELPKIVNRKYKTAQ